MKLASDTRELLNKVAVSHGTLADPCECKFWEILESYENLDEVDIVLIGIPYDTTSIFNRGSYAAPETIRKILYSNREYEPYLQVDISCGLSISDLGNIKVLQTNPEMTEQRIMRVICEVVERGTIPIVMGGDHWTTFGTVKGLSKAIEGNVGVITFDAHPDLREAHQGEITNGTPFGRLLKDEAVQLRPSNLVELGINGWHNSRYYLTFMTDNKITYFTAPLIHEKGISSITKEAIQRAGDGTKAFFLSIDVDVFDTAFAPGTGSPNPGGLYPRDVLSAVVEIAGDSRCIGMDIVEVFPNRDVNNITSVLAAHIIQNFIAGKTIARNKSVGRDPA